MKQKPAHINQIPKINRALGQLQAVERMISDDKYCVDILSQLRAARNAIKSIELGVLETHMSSCLAVAHRTPSVKEEKITEIISLLKKYE